MTCLIMKGEYNTKEKEKEEPAEKSHFDFVEIDIVDTRKLRKRPTLTLMSPDDLPGSLAASTEKLLDESITTSYSSISDSQKGYGAAELESDKKLPYPKSVFFIITNEFCERFSYYGMKAVLSLFLINVLEYSEDKSTVIYHVFSMLCYFTPVFGAMIADSLLGKFKTILYLSIVYAIGNVVLSAAATPPLQIPQETFTMLGLLLIAIGTGGIKPCVSAFGGDQFVLPQQAMQLASFFSIFYFAINAGSLVSTLITPIFRKDVKCFDSETCYPLAFGVPAVLMVVSLIVFVIGKPWYNCRKPEGNITMDVGKCVTYAIKQKSKSKDRREHWLDHASGKYDSELIESIKRLLKILVLYIPLPVFWALFDQQGSRWTFQATRMNGEVFGSFTIKPDQMQVLNPFLILAFIPIFDQLIYPAFAKIGLLKKPLQRLTVGGVLAGIAFVVSGILELQLEPTYAVKLGANEAHVNFINGLPCSVRMEIGDINSTQIEPFGQHILKQIEGGKTYAAKFTPAGEGCSSYKPFDYQLETTNEEARSYMIMGDGTTASIKKANTPDKLKKDGEGASKLKFLFIGFDDPTSRNGTIQFREGDELMKVWQEPDIETDEHGKRVKPVSVKGVQVADFDSGIYKMEPHETTLVLMTPNIESQDISKKYVTIGTIKPKQGGNYLYVIKKESGDKFKIRDYVITQPNSIHMLWLIPQFVIITVGEVMFSVTGLQFAFSQAPSSMKSVLQASWLLTVAFGNVIVVFLAEFKPFEEQSKEFFLYSGLMFVDMIIFAVLAYFYIPVEISEEDDKDTNTVEMRESSPTRKKNEEYKEA